MRKVLFLLAMILSLSASAEIHHLKAVSIIATDGEGVLQEKVDIDVILNLDESRCVIYSKKVQVIDFEIIRIYTDEDNYQVMECTATDSNYRNILFEFSIHNARNQALISITYNDFVYIYICYVV